MELRYADRHPIQGLSKTNAILAKREEIERNTDGNLEMTPWSTTPSIWSRLSAMSAANVFHVVRNYFMSSMKDEK